ncbi:hypothetical protein PBRA_000446, partial [Plasmodiophora brassicae]
MEDPTVPETHANDNHIGDVPSAMPPVTGDQSPRNVPVAGDTVSGPTWERHAGSPAFPNTVVDVAPAAGVPETACPGSIAGDAVSVSTAVPDQESLGRPDDVPLPDAGHSTTPLLLAVSYLEPRAPQAAAIADDNHLPVTGTLEHRSVPGADLSGSMTPQEPAIQSAQSNAGTADDDVSATIVNDEEQISNPARTSANQPSAPDAQTVPSMPDTPDPEVKPATVVHDTAAKPAEEPNQLMLSTPGNDVPVCGVVDQRNDDAQGLREQSPNRPSLSLPVINEPTASAIPTPRSPSPSTLTEHPARDVIVQEPTLSPAAAAAAAAAEGLRSNPQTETVAIPEAGSTSSDVCNVPVANNLVASAAAAAAAGSHELRPLKLPNQPLAQASPDLLLGKPLSSWDAASLAAAVSVQFSLTPEALLAPDPDPLPAEPAEPIRWPLGKVETHTWSNGDEFTGQLDRDTGTRIGRLDYIDGRVFKGTVSADDYRLRDGTLRWTNGNTFEGVWMENGKHDGVYTWRNGTIFKGVLSDGFTMEHGLYRWTNGNTFDGKWEPDGTHSGVLTNRNGSVFHGTMTKDFAFRHGTYRWANGEHFQGTWNDDGTHDGQFTWVNGNTFSGLLSRKFSPKNGVMSWPNGNAFQGVWLEDGAHDGTFTFADGRVFTGILTKNYGLKRGEFRWATKSFTGVWNEDGTRDGKFTFANGNVFEGLMTNTYQMKKGVLTWKNGAAFDGTFLDDGTHEGVMTFADRRVFRGLLSDRFSVIAGTMSWPDRGSESFEGRWLPDGYREGVFRYADGSVFRGRLNAEFRCKSGVLTWPNGNAFDGVWNDDGTHRGTFSSFNGNRFEGTMRRGFLMDEGQIKWAASGNTFNGQWLADGTQRGTFLWANGDEFSGDMSVRFQPTKGILKWKNGDAFDGIWRDDGTRLGTFTWGVTHETYRGVIDPQWTVLPRETRRRACYVIMVPIVVLLEVPLLALLVSATLGVVPFVVIAVIIALLGYAGAYLSQSVSIDDRRYQSALAAATARPTADALPANGMMPMNTSVIVPISDPGPMPKVGWKPPAAAQDPTACQDPAPEHRVEPPPDTLVNARAI